MSEPKECPILFSGPMVRAILDGRKTQTRRVIRLPLGYEHNEVYGYEGVYGGLHALACDPGPSRAIRCPYGVPGDRLWVRETWQQFFADEIPPERPRGPRGTMGIPAAPGREAFAYYRADGELAHEQLGGARWMPSIHMPRWASRILLEVTNVRVERLQSISEENAQAEGIRALDSYMGEPGWYAADARNPHVTVSRTAVNAFACLWDRTSDRRHTWASDPWVWVVSFKVVEVSCG